MRFFVLLLLFSATYSPVLAEEVTWKSDGWLATIGLERLDKGDEFGCYGMPDANWEAEPVAVPGHVPQSEKISFKCLAVLSQVGLRERLDDAVVRHFLDFTEAPVEQLQSQLLPSALESSHR